MKTHCFFLLISMLLMVGFQLEAQTDYSITVQSGGEQTFGGFVAPRELICLR